MNYDYFKTVGAAVTVADKVNKIVYMNDKSIAVFANEGGCGNSNESLPLIPIKTSH